MNSKPRLITYLPYPSLTLTASSLHTDELEQARHSALEILYAIIDPRLARSSTLDHPCTRMWQTYPLKLISYALTLNCEWTSRGNEDKATPEIATLQNLLPRAKWDRSEPWWWMLPAVSRSHQSLLMELRPGWYSAWFSKEELRPGEPIFWPVGPGLAPVPF